MRKSGWPYSHSAVDWKVDHEVQGCYFDQAKGGIIIRGKQSNQQAAACDTAG